MGSGDVCGAFVSRESAAIPALLFVKSDKTYSPQMQFAYVSPSAECAAVFHWSKLVEYDFLDVFNVPPHRRFGGFRVLALDGG